MLVVPSKSQSNVGKDREKRTRDTFFCALFQRGECNLDSPHIARIGLEGAEKMVHHICSTCLIKDGKKLTHPNGVTVCPRRN